MTIDRHLVLWIAGALATVALPPPAGAYEVVAVEGGSVSGVVRFEDAYPPREPIKTSRDVATCGLKYLSEEFIVDPDSKGLQSVVVSLIGVEAGKPFPEDVELSLDQVGCRFEPHVQYGFHRGKVAASTGGSSKRGVELVIVNSDDVLHNVHGFDERERTAFNVASVPATTIANRVRRPGTYEVRCDVHLWMSAWIVIVEHPYVTLSNGQGEFEITDVPPGDYELRIWHEGLGEVLRSVSVQAGEDSVVELVVGGAE